MRFAVFIALLIVAALPAQAAPSTPAIEERWVDIRYVMTDAKTRLSAIRDLEDQSLALITTHPGETEPKVWHALVLLLEAEFKPNLSSLKIVGRAKKLLEQAEAENPEVMDGRILTTLGILYADVPGWPIAFGDDHKATEYFLKGLQASPQGLESNYLYADFLANHGRAEESVPYYETAARAPLRPGHERADGFRRKEVQEDLAKVRAKLKS